MARLRHDFHAEIVRLEELVLEMAARVEQMLSDALAALVTRDFDRAAALVRADDVIDALSHEVDEGVFRTLALQAPVAGELRLLAVLVHVNLHLERVGDLAVNVAKFVRLVGDAPADATLAAQIQEMGQHAIRVVSRAMEAFARRDVDAARELPALDDPVDRLNRGLFRRLVEMASADPERLDWAMRMVLVTRYLERVGDHAVDIGEQVAFLVTGERISLSSNDQIPELGG